MLFFVTPQAAPQYVYDPEESLFSDYKRRQYIAALEEQEQRAQFEHELALEEQRHRIALQSIARKEAARRQQQENARFARYAEAAAAQQQQPRYSQFCGHNSHCQPSPEEILKRRQARQQEEERRSREFHERILSQIFGAPVGREESTQPAEKEKASRSAPVDTTPIDRKGKGKAEETTLKRPREEEQEPHWSAAPERARALAETTSIHRAFNSLKNTFVFPSGPLERLPDSDIPRLAYNPTNASIHAYEHALSELLTKLDGVESHGFRGVREARKQLVVKIEKELEELEKRIAERLAEAASPAKGSVAIPTESTAPADIIVPIEGPSDNEGDVEMDEPATSTTAARPEEKEVEVQQSSILPTESVASATVGYDVELDQEPEVQSTPADDASKTTTVHEEKTEVAETHPMEVEVPAVDAPAADQVVAPLQTEVSASDEESEIEDAIRIDISSEGEDNVDVEHGPEAEHLDDAFEML